MADDRQDKVVVFTPRRRGGVKEGIDFRLAHGLPRKSVEGHRLGFVRTGTEIRQVVSFYPYIRFAQGQTSG